MSMIVEATFSGGVLVPKTPLDLVEGDEVEVVRKAGEGPLEGLIGACADGPDISLAERHDGALFGGNTPNDDGDPLAGIIGICDSPDAPTHGAANHDRYLFGDLRR